MRVEQRISRIDRLGQTFERVRIINLHYADTVETDVYRSLCERIGLFQSVVGKPQPILARLPTLIADSILKRKDSSAIGDPARLRDIGAEAEQAIATPGYGWAGTAVVPPGSRAARADGAADGGPAMGPVGAWDGQGGSDLDRSRFYRGASRQYRTLVTGQSALSGPGSRCRAIRITDYSTPRYAIETCIRPTMNRCRPNGGGVGNDPRT